MTTANFAILGASPHFEQTIPVGQLYFPDWSRYEMAMRGIFERQYYTNNGPLLTELEAKLADFVGVKHAICTHNATFGLMMLAEALELTGKVILPSFTFIASAQSLAWTKLKPVFCDVDRATHQLDLNHLESLIDDEVSAIMGVNLWGGACDTKALQSLADKHKIKLYFDSAHAFGCEINDRKVGSFGNAEVFSFHATKILSATEGGCITTNDDALAARLKAIRPSYSNDPAVAITKVINARMSEAQAAVALMSLADLEDNRHHNETIYLDYHKQLASIPGIKLVQPTGVTRSNYQYLVCELNPESFGLTRDQVIAVLQAENIIARRYFYPGCHRSLEFFDDEPVSLPATEALCDVCLQLPIGAKVDSKVVTGICTILKNAQQHALKLRAELAAMVE